MSFTQVVFSEENENLNSKTYQTIVSVRWYTDARASNHGRFRTFVSPLAKSSFPLANFQINFQVSGLHFTEGLLNKHPSYVGRTRINRVFTYLDICQHGVSFDILKQIFRLSLESLSVRSGNNRNRILSK